VAKTVLLWRRHQLDPSAKDQDGARIGRQAPQPTEAPLVLGLRRFFWTQS